MVFTARRRAMWPLSASEPAAASLVNVDLQKPYVHFSGSLKARFLHSVATRRTRRTMRYAAMFLLLTGVSMSQIPDAPSVVHDPTFVALCAAQLVSTGLDAYATSRIMSSGGIEYNPLDRPFVSHGNAVLAASWSVESTLSIMVSARLQRRGHKTLGRVLQISEIAGHSYGAYYSLAHYRRVR
jgi:hypothetical protein